MAAVTTDVTRYIPTSRAAKLLEVDVGTLRAWTERYGFPAAVITRGHRRLVSVDDVLALRDALRAEWSIPGAIQRARATARDMEIRTRRQGADSR